MESTVADILGAGSGARRQREAYSTRHDLSDVMSLALDVTHRDGPVQPTDVPTGTGQDGKGTGGHPDNRR